MRSRTGWLLLVVAIGFSVGLAFPYLGLDRADSRLEVQAAVEYALLVVHIATAALALVLGPLQFIPRIRRRRRIHRTIGRAYLLLGVAPSALCAIPVAIWSGRLLTQIGLTTAAVLWVITGVLAYRAARRRDFAAHRAWMMRNYALTFLAVTSRLLTPLLLLAQIPLTDADPASLGDRAASMIPVGQTLGWILNLIIVEIVLRRGLSTGRTARAPRPSAPAASSGTR
ncbi:DUF2306 domain-containing protein [Brachybacterium sacelli]|uniref:Membrane protein n=1 Tax=Brachybacterium sacelli TaxID=173364 RepID=A0ABS4WXM5_9MICO|nr:DUF2306 domain-containing protein [Brachybacterium sacelli]MBP2380723.1 putative membrane protein [Brachybacterium sacelli]